jgi:hypothetical protein
MKKLLAFSGLASSVAVWAMTAVAPKLLGILLVLAFNNLGGPYTFNSGGVGSTLVSFALGYFNAGGVTQAELFLGL